mgnify:CR=1 FL=1
MPDQPTEQQTEKPKTPRELAFDNMCDVLVKAFRESDQKGEKQAR